MPTAFRVFAALVIAGTILGTSLTQAADVTSTWGGSSANWSVAGNWVNVPPVTYYPNNGNGGYTYDAAINSGNVTQDLVGGITIEKLMLSGGWLTGDYDLTLNDLLTWTGGTLSGSGTTYADGGVTISGSSIKNLYRTVNNTGLATWTGTGYIYASSGGVFNNLAGAMFDVQSDLQITYSSTHGTFNNAGTFRKSAGAGNTYIDAVFNNTGSVEVQTGTLRLFYGGTSAGTFDVSPGAKLMFSGGSHTLNVGTTFTGVDAVAFGGGAVTFNTPYDAVHGATFSGATVTFNAAVSNLPANLVVNGGSVNFNGNSSLTFDTITASGGVGGSADIIVNGLYTMTGGWASPAPNGTTGTGTTYANGGMSISSSSDYIWCSVSARPGHRPQAGAA